MCWTRSAASVVPFTPCHHRLDARRSLLDGPWRLFCTLAALVACRGCRRTLSAKTRSASAALILPPWFSLQAAATNSTGKT
jgi:hypothetical protein